MKMKNKKNNIVNIYTHWWFSGTSEVAQDKEKVKNATLLRKKIISKVENDINLPLKNTNFKFKIHFHPMNDEQYTRESILNFFDEKDIDIVCKYPRGFKKEDNKNYFENKIILDPSNTFNNATNGTHNHPNLFHIPSANTLVNTYNNDVPKLFDGKKLTKLIFVKTKEDSFSEKKINLLEKEAVEKNWHFEIIYDWEANDCKGLRNVLMRLKDNHVILLDKTSFIDGNGNVCDGPTYVRGRNKVVQVFMETETKLDIVGFRLHIPTIMKMFKEIDVIKNSNVYVFVGDDYVEKLELQDFILSFNPKKYDNPTLFIQDQIDKIKLLSYLYKNGDYTYTNKKDFIQETRKRLLRLNGVDDSFLGLTQLNYFDKNQFSRVNPNPLIQFSPTLNGAKANYYSKQIVSQKGGLELVNVSYKNFDFLSIDHVSIENNEFSVTFNLELTTPFDEGIEILQFNNLLRDSLQYKLLNKDKLANGYIYFRYFVSGTFSFIPYAENYPFDTQSVFISYSLSGNKFGLLEPIKNYYDDKLISDGWNINGFRSGIVRRKEQFNPIFENQYMLTSEEHKIEILISRPSSYTITKTLVPLLFLGGLALWATFLPIDQIEAIIASVTTAFLSAIALYFSTEKPKPLTLTTTDLIFLLFYLFVGLASVSIFLFMQFFPQSYYDGMAYTRWGLGVFSLLSALFIYQRIKY